VIAKGDQCDVLTVRQRINQFSETVSDMGDIATKALAVVDQNRNLHGHLGPLHPQHLPPLLVLFDDELIPRQIQDRLPAPDHADEDGLLEFLRIEVSAGPSEPTSVSAAATTHVRLAVITYPRQFRSPPRSWVWPADLRLNPVAVCRDYTRGRRTRQASS
jgi:hypothetical protein